MKIRFTICCLLSIAFRGYGQDTIPTSAGERMNSLQVLKGMKDSSLVKNVPFRNIGPTIMGGRVVDVAVNPEKPEEFYVAYASGGLWHSINNGQSFVPVFDHEAAITLGAIAVNWQSLTIWAGTGESNSSRSSYAGTGVYVSSDSGKTWEHRGLEDSHHIGRIVLDPSSPLTAWVAVTGHLYSPNSERGVYKTTDGGKTWKKVLYLDDNTGAIDLALDPVHTNILYATMWHRERRAWNFVESGNTSGIYKSTDGGETWKCITVEGSGFPLGEGTGRIGIAVFPANPDILYALLDNQAARTDTEPRDTSTIIPADLKGISRENFLKLSDRKLDKFLRNNNFPEKYTSGTVKSLIRSDSIGTQALTDYLNDANNSLFDTPIIGAEVFRSDDAGKSWRKTHDYYLKNLVYTYGYYFGKITVSPVNDKKIIVCGVPVLLSTDGGKSFTSIDAGNTHGDFHAAWMDPKNDAHMILGNDGGLNITYDNGEHWFKVHTPPVGQFYSVTYDMDTPYNVYGGLQDNGIWTGSSQTDPDDPSWLQDGQYPYRFLLGGDGMQVQVDPRDNTTVYAGFQFGYYFRIHKNNPDDAVSVKPVNDLGEPNYRFNWQSPIWLSVHQPDILYFGSNKIHRSLNKGNDMKTMSEDLTYNDRKGDVAFNTITTIHESPVRFGMLYCGTDDGKIWRSTDAGYSWEPCFNGLPKRLWVSRITASSHKMERVYASLNGYRYDNFHPYIFVSDDQGNHWKNISSNLPDEPVNVIREDPVQEKFLYAGTDNGIYMSMDGGESWMPFEGGLPRVPVHDLAIHPRDHDLIAGTHGRSIYIASLKQLEALNDSILQAPLYLFEPTVPAFSKDWGKRNTDFGPEHSPVLSMTYYSNHAGLSTVNVMTQDRQILNSFIDSTDKGLNYLSDTLFIDNKRLDAFRKKLKKSGDASEVRASDDGNYYLIRGKYRIEISGPSGTILSKDFEITDREKQEVPGSGDEPRESFTK